MVVPLDHKLAILSILTTETVRQGSALDSSSAANALRANGYGDLKTRFAASKVSDVLREVPGITIKPPSYSGGVTTIVVDALAAADERYKTSVIAEDRASRRMAQCTKGQPAFADSGPKEAMNSDEHARLIDHIQSSIDAVLDRCPLNIMAFIQALTDMGVTVTPNVSTIGDAAGKMNGFRFGAGGISSAGSDLGRRYGWSALKEAGVIYDPSVDFEPLRDHMIAVKGWPDILPADR